MQSVLLALEAPNAMIKIVDILGSLTVHLKRKIGALITNLLREQNNGDFRYTPLHVTARTARLNGNDRETQKYAVA